MTSAHLDGNVLHTRQAGGQAGVVLELTIKGDGFYDVFYTLDVNMGTPAHSYPLLVDTGSSDLWIAAPSCGCATSTPSYDPTSSTTSTTLSQSLSARYLSGSLSGPLYTDTLSLGPYTLPHQAFCGATHVENEKMGLGFSGIIGLGLTGMSEIQQLLTGNAGNADGQGAPVALNLFDASLVANTPTARWFSLVLDRPGFNEMPSTSANNNTNTNTTPSWSHNWPARLGIGQHVEEVVHAFSLSSSTSGDSIAALESTLQPLPLVTTPGGGTGPGGFTHWKTRFSGVTVYTTSGEGNATSVTAQDVRLSRGVDGGAYPVVVLDSGGANVLASRAVADAIYGVLGVQQGSDGMYYVPCKTPINITITLASSAPIPIHPLDMSTYPNNNPNTGGDCLGTIQASDMLGTSSSPADIALGISFLRNVYVVHQLETPSSTGTGANPATPTPRLAIAPLTNPTLALVEFQNVRVKNLSPSGLGAAPPPMSGNGEESLSMLSKIFLGVGVFVGACILLFAIRWFVLRRRFNELRRRGMASGAVSMDGHASGVRRGGPGGGTLARRKGGGTGRWAMDGVDDFVEMIRRKTTVRSKRRRREKKIGLGGGWKEVSEVGHEEGLSGAVATRSAIGHGGGGDSGLGHALSPISPEAAAAYPGPYTGTPTATTSLFPPATGAPPGAGAGANAFSPRDQERMEYGLRPEPQREGSGPFAGFSLWTFIGAKRLLGPRKSQRGGAGGGGYERTANPNLPGEGDVDGAAGTGAGGALLTEDQLRKQRYEAHVRRQHRENEASVWSDVTWVERGDGTLVPAGTAATAAGASGVGKHLRHSTDEFGERRGYGYPGTPNETIVGSSTNLIPKGKNDYGFPKETKGGESDEDDGSTVHGSMDFGHGKGRGMGAGKHLHSRSRSASKEVIPLFNMPPSSTGIGMGMGMASTSSLGTTIAPVAIPGSRSRSGSGGQQQGPGHMTHRSVPSLELGHPSRLDSSGIITASPYPMTGTPGEGSSPFGPFGTPPRTSATPPRMSATPPRIPSTPPQVSSTPPQIPMGPPPGGTAQFGADGFNPYAIPTTVHAPPPTLVHPARDRVALAMEPGLSPLTEVNSAEFPPSTNRMSIMSIVVPPPGAAADWNNNGGKNEEGPHRQSSIGAMSMESEVLVPLPISFMDFSRSSHSSSPAHQPLTFIQTGEQYTPPEVNPGPQPPADWGRAPPAQTFVPPPPPPKMDASRTLPAQKAPPVVHPSTTSYTLPSQPSSNSFYPPIVPVAAPPPVRQPAATPPVPNQPRLNNPFDLLADDFTVGGSRDSRFPSRDTLGLGAQDSRFPSFAPPPSAAISRPQVPSMEPNRPTPVAIPQEAARPRIRTGAPSMEQARPQSEAINFGVGGTGDPPVGNSRDDVNRGEQPWMKPRSYSHGNATLPTTISRAPEPRVPVQLVDPPTMRDFAPPHEYRLTRPEQRTLPVMGTSRSQERPPLATRTSEPASSSMGARSRGPRPMMAGPRNPRSTGSSGSPHSPPVSPPSSGNPFRSRQGTNYDSPLSPASLPSVSPMTSSHSSSLPPGAQAPSDSRSHHRLPSIPRDLGSPPIPIFPTSSPPASHQGSPPNSAPFTYVPPIRDQNPALRAGPGRSVTVENDPNASYGGMTGEEGGSGQAGWRTEAARTAGVAGMGARSRFTGPVDPYPSPFDDRS